MENLDRNTFFQRKIITDWQPGNEIKKSFVAFLILRPSKKGYNDDLDFESGKDPDP